MSRKGLKTMKNKKQAVFTLAACSIAALVLLGVLAVGLRSDGFGLGKLMKGEAGLSKEGNYKYEYSWDPEGSQVTGIDMEWINGTVELKVGSGKDIQIIETAGRNLDDGEKLELSSSDGTLKIKWKHQLISFSLFQNHYKNLTVEVPKELAGSLEELTCANTSGKIDASGFTAEKQHFSSASGDIFLSDMKGESLDISSTSGGLFLENGAFEEKFCASNTSGEMEFTGVKAGKADLNTVSGEVSYHGAAGEFNANSVSGGVRGTLSACPEKADLDSVSGSLALAVPENPGFEVEFSSVSGSFSSDFPVTGDTGKSGRALYSSGKAKLSFSTTSGDMEVRKAD